MKARTLKHPVFLLLITGTLIGFNFPLGKIGSMSGVSPMVWALVVSLGASLMLLPFLMIKGQLKFPTGRMLRYVLISGVVSFIAPNLLLFSVIPYVGSGYAGLMFALSPVFTLSLAMLFQLKGPKVIGISGIIFGLIGVIIVTITRGSAPEAPQILWVVAALFIPALLACGNIYRTLSWPEGAMPDTLAFWSHAFAAILFIILLFIKNDSFPVAEFSLAPWALLAQALIAGMTYPVFFRLQQAGGPVLLSQIGYVAAAVGLIAATVFLGEYYSAMTWLGVGVIAFGIAATSFSQFKER